MDQWSIVTSLSVLVGLAAAVTGPIVKLNSTIARLSAILEHVLNRLDKLEGEPVRKPPVPVGTEERRIL